MAIDILTEVDLKEFHISILGNIKEILQDKKSNQKNI